MEHLYADLRARLDQVEFNSSARFTRLTQEARVLLEGQRRIFSHTIGPELALGQATSDLLAYQRYLNTLQADFLGAEHPGPSTQRYANHSQPLGAAHTALPDTNVRGAGLVATTILPNIPPLPQYFNRGRVPERKVCPEMVPDARVKMSPTSAPLPRDEVSAEATPQLCPYAPGFDPSDIMLAPLATLMYYHSYRLADTKNMSMAEYYTSHPSHQDSGR